MEIDQETLSLLNQLRNKYTKSGQDINAYLEGLLHANYLNYWDYVEVDTLLTLQKPRTPIKDEVIFIIYHQITELYFRLTLHEMEQIADQSENIDPDFFASRVKRMNSYFRNLTHSFEIMVDGTFSPSTSVEIAIGMQLIASAGTLDYWVFASDALAYINYDGSRHYQFMIIGKIVCTGTANLKLRAVDQMGATADNLLNFSGRALINKVGSIG
jgi:hypothetical protein